jgi:dipeptidyl aminopeptidase/acylaminoacyl peptidase
MSVEDLFEFQRLADPQVSPDGKWVAYTVTTIDLKGNRTRTAIWLASTDQATRHPLTNPVKHDRHPRWSPDGRQILFESDRSGDQQLWTIAVNGGEARQLTTIATEAGNGIWSPDAKSIAFVSAVFPEYSAQAYSASNTLNKKRLDEIASSPVKARVFTHLFYRHWNDWVGDRRQHLFVMPSTGGEPRDLTPGDRDAYPTSTTFSVGDDFVFTPDSTGLVYTAVPSQAEAWSTNYDLYRVSASGGAPVQLTRNPAADGGPRFSPDGKWLLYRAQRKPGYEADRWELMLMDAAGQQPPRSLTASFDGNPESYVWSADGNQVYFSAQDGPRFALYAVSATDGLWRKIWGGRMITDLTISSDGKELAFSQAAIQYPAEVFLVSTATFSGTPAPRNISQANEHLLAGLDLPEPESVSVKGAGDRPMQMWILKPPGFQAGKKWPLAFLVHGGPQGAWEDGWSYRWNPEAWAAQGYVVALPNPRGSTGFGQKYVEEISGDWGGKCFEDLMAGVEYLEKLPYVDSQRMAAAGASFGGYMMDWFEGHTDKFKTLITHCGVYNFESMYATTDELWFDEWEHGGPPWKNGREYQRHSPHRFAKNFKTPMLIIHNDLDFRVPVSEGFQLFTTLQRLGVPSKMINFPDEGHWVLKPANSEYWYREVFAWLTKYVPPGDR